MLIFACRHAEKLGSDWWVSQASHRLGPTEATWDESNPPLTDRGRRQSLELADFLTDFFRSQSLELWASPKLRTQQTLQPLSEKLKANILVKNDLNEQQLNESNLEFEHRMRTLLAQLANHNTNPAVVLCTHYDVMIKLAELMKDVLVAPDEFSSGDVQLGAPNTDDTGSEFGLDAVAFEGSFFYNWSPTQGYVAKLENKKKWILLKLYRPHF